MDQATETAGAATEAAADTTAAATQEGAQATADSTVLTGAQPGETKTDEQSTETAKTDEPQGAPEQYEAFSFGEGAEFDQEVLADFQGLAKELNLPQATAQKLVDLQAKLYAKQAEASQQQLQTLRSEWANQVRNDPEFGGANYDANVAIAAKTMQAFGSDSLRQLLNDSGLGNHPEMVKFAHRIGMAISEDRLVMGGTQNAGPKTIEDRLWGGN